MADGFWSFLPDAEPGSDDRPTATQLLGAEYGVSNTQHEQMDEQIGIDRDTDAAQAAGPTESLDTTQVTESVREAARDAMPDPFDGFSRKVVLGAAALLGLAAILGGER